MVVQVNELVVVQAVVQVNGLVVVCRVNGLGDGGRLYVCRP